MLNRTSFLNVEEKVLSLFTIKYDVIRLRNSLLFPVDKLFLSGLDVRFCQVFCFLSTILATSSLSLLLSFLPLMLELLEVQSSAPSLLVPHSSHL